MTVQSLTRDQANQVSALAMIAWALLDAESHNDRATASSLVPVFVSSWNVWSSAIQVWSPNAPSSLNIAGSWTTDHDRALRYAIGTFAVNQMSDPSAVLDALDAMPGGAVPNAMRGVWFGTSSALDALRATGHIDAWITTVLSDSHTDGAAGVSTFADSLSRGLDPTTNVPVLPSQVPAVPQQTTHPSPAQAASFVMPHNTTLPPMTITGTAPHATEEFPIIPVLAVGGVLTFGLGLAAVAVHKRWLR